MRETLSQYEALKKVYKVGHPISVKIIQYEQINDSVNYRIHVETKKGIKGFIDLDSSSDQQEKTLPRIGESLDAIIKNYNSDANILYLSLKREDLEESTINSYKQFYNLITKFKEGTKLTGTVLHIQPFGIFVDIGQDFLGLIDIGHSNFIQGTELPLDHSEWPQKGDPIKCIVSYYRFSNKQFGLSWTP